MTTNLDPRLVTAGIHLSAELLLDLWADHRPAHYPVPATCDTCGHTYTFDRPYCPTAAVVRPLLRHRRHEIGMTAISLRLTYLQQTDLLTSTRASTTLPSHPAPEPTDPVAPATPALF